MSTPPPARPAPEGTESNQAPLPVRLLADVDRLAAVPLWPNYELGRYPVAIYDGEQTWLFRHPSPPSEFAASPAYSGARIFAGLHAAVRANSTANIGGIPTATAMLHSTRRRSLPELAALVIHELFHVFQDQRHPDWRANELDLFSYPMEDAALLQQRLETEALRRALRAPRETERRGWAATALALRKHRFAQLSPEAVAYERGSELREGLATYVERKALGDTDPAALLPDDFAADGIRQRCYAAGHALALLLDAEAPGWVAELEAGPTRPLDLLLETALARSAVAPAAFTGEERERALERAHSDVAALVAQRAARRDAFLALPGWQLVVVAARGETLQARGFDPSNVHRLGPGEALHTRFIQLGNKAGSLEVLYHQALTEAAGSHPLFGGVKKATVAGLVGEPEIRVQAGRVEVAGDGVVAAFQGASVERELWRTVVRLAV